MEINNVEGKPKPMELNMEKTNLYKKHALKYDQGSSPLHLPCSLIPSPRFLSYFGA
jgi:hypothetical protein